jgi:hypothetical protein
MISTRLAGSLWPPPAAVVFLGPLPAQRVVSVLPSSWWLLWRLLVRWWLLGHLLVRRLLLAWYQAAGLIPGAVDCNFVDLRIFDANFVDARIIDEDRVLFALRLRDPARSTRLLYITVDGRFVVLFVVLRRRWWRRLLERLDQTLADLLRCHVFKVSILVLDQVQPFA